MYDICELQRYVCVYEFADIVSPGSFLYYNEIIPGQIKIDALNLFILKWSRTDGILFFPTFKVLNEAKCRRPTTVYDHLL